jgi:hypothetical protein
MQIIRKGSISSIQRLSRRYLVYTVIKSVVHYSQTPKKSIPKASNIWKELKRGFRKFKDLTIDYTRELEYIDNDEVDEIDESYILSS